MTRFFDIIFSLIAIIILFPFMLPIRIGLKFTGEHDIFYGQERIGKDGKSFKLLKFATMLRNSPNLPGGLYTSKNDPRMLPMGRFLRKTKINELPQLLNILSGQMSIIGYRPLVKSDYEAYPGEVKEQLGKSRPGLSGIGSIVFRNEEEICQRFETYDEKEAFYKGKIIPYKGKLEAWYASNRSVRLYCTLIIRTVEAVWSANSKAGKKLKGIPGIADDLIEYL